MKNITLPVTICERGCKKPGASENLPVVRVPTAFYHFCEALIEQGKNRPPWWVTAWTGGKKLPARTRVRVAFDKKRLTFVAHFKHGHRLLPVKALSIDVPLCFGTKVRDDQHPWDTVLKGHCATGIKNLYETLLREIPDLGAALCAGPVS